MITLDSKKFVARIEGDPEKDIPYHLVNRRLDSPLIIIPVEDEYVQSQGLKAGDNVEYRILYQGNKMIFDILKVEDPQKEPIK